MFDESTLSRRGFLKGAAAGAVGAAAMIGGSRRASAAGREIGEITVDGLLLTYLPAPIAANAGAQYRLGRAYETTLGVAPSAAPDLALRASVPAAKQRFFLGLPFAQAESGRVNGAITVAQRHAPGSSETFGAGPPGEADSTTFLVLYRARLRVAGSPERPRYRFVGEPGAGGGALLVTNAAQLRARPNDFGLAPATADSFLAQYATDPAALVGPRYAFVGSYQPPFTLEAPASQVPSERVSAATKATIVSQTGFESGDLADVFAVGNTLDVSYFSAQEHRSGTLVFLETSADGPAAVQDVYWDAVFKTFVLVERA